MRTPHDAIRNDYCEGAYDLPIDVDRDVVPGGGGARIDIGSVRGSIVVSRTMEV
jgi:hypothetical protein